MSEDTLYGKTLIEEKMDFIKKNNQQEKKTDFNEKDEKDEKSKEKALKKEVKYLMKKLLQEKGKKK